LKGVIINQEFDIAMVGRNNLWEWSTGVKLTMERSSYNANANSSDIASLHSVSFFQKPSQFHSFRGMVFGMINRPIQKKGIFSGGLSVGAGNVRVSQENSSAKKTAPLFKAMMGYIAVPNKKLFCTIQHKSAFTRENLFPSVITLNRSGNDFESCRRIGVPQYPVS
jgi:hypothetical protein